MTRRLERPTDPTMIRLELEPADMPAVEDAAHACRLSLASYCRLAIEMLSKTGRTSVEDVKKEADRRLSKADPKKKK